MVCKVAVPPFTCKISWQRRNRAAIVVLIPASSDFMYFDDSQAGLCGFIGPGKELSVRDLPGLYPAGIFLVNIFQTRRGLRWRSPLSTIKVNSHISSVSVQCHWNPWRFNDDCSHTSVVNRYSVKSVTSKIVKFLGGVGNDCHNSCWSGRGRA